MLHSSKHQQDLKFSTYWEKYHKRPKLYYFKESILYWALPFTLFKLFFEFKDHQFHLFSGWENQVILVFGINVFLGILKAFFQFRVNDKRYRNIESNLPELKMNELST